MKSRFDGVCAGTESVYAYGIARYGKGLFKRDDGRYQVVEPGKTCRILISCPPKVLIRSDLLTAFQELGVVGFTSTSAIIFRRTTGEQWENYHELDVASEITPENIRSIDNSGLRIWHFNCGRVNIFGELYVSPALKFSLDQLQLTDLEFHENFGMLLEKGALSPQCVSR